MFKFLKKKNEDSPPDVGKEDVITEVPVEPDDSSGGSNYEEEISKKSKESSVPSGGNYSNESTRFELEKINARIEADNALIKSFNERFMNISQQIGEIRTMALANEKSISRSGLEAQKVVDIVKEVKPDQLRIDYQKIDMKVASLSEKLESNKQFFDSILEEVKDLKRKAGLFEGTDALLKLNDDVKKDLLEIQKTASRVKMNADKSEQIFIELRKGFADNQKTNEIIDNLNNMYSGVQKEVEKLRLDHSQVIKDKDFNDFKRNIDSHLQRIESTFGGVQKIGENNDKMERFIEEVLALEKRNEEDIADIGATLGKENIKRVGAYEDKLISILNMMDKMAFEINNIKTSLGLRKPDEKIITILPNQPPKSPASSDLKEIHNDVKEDNLILPNQPTKSSVSSDLKEDNHFQNVSIIDSKNEVSKSSDKNVIATSETNKNNISDIKNNYSRDISEFPCDIGFKPIIPMRKSQDKIDNSIKINNLLLDGGSCLVKKDLFNAQKIYRDVLSLYKPELDKDKSLYYRIVRFYENILRFSSQPVLSSAGKSI
jgi:hypothetical protein